MKLHTGHDSFTFSKDSEEPIDGMFVAERTKTNIQGLIVLKKCLNWTFLAPVSYNTHFLLISGGSFMSFCILEEKTVHMFLVHYLLFLRPNN